VSKAFGSVFSLFKSLVQSPEEIEEERRKKEKEEKERLEKQKLAEKNNSQKTKKAQQVISQQDLLNSLKTLPPSIVGEVVERQDKKIMEQLVSDEPPLNENDENRKFFKKQIDFVKLNLDLVRERAWAQGIHFSVRPVIWKVLSGAYPIYCFTHRAVLYERYSFYDLHLQDYSIKITGQRSAKAEFKNTLLGMIRISMNNTALRIPEFKNKSLSELIERIVFILAKDTTIHATFIDSLSQLILPVLFVLIGVEQKMQEEKRKRKLVLLEEDAKKNSPTEPSSLAEPKSPKSLGKSGEKSNYILNMAQEGTLTAEQLKDMEVEVYYVLENFIDRYYREHLQIAPTIIVSHFVQLLQLLDEPLYNHFKKNEISFLSFIYPWFQNFLIREFEKVSLTVQIWDRMFGYIGTTKHGLTKFYMCFIASVLIQFSDKFRALDNSEAVTSMLCNMPVSDLSYRVIDHMINRTVTMINGNEGVQKILIAFESAATPAPPASDNSNNNNNTNVPAESTPTTAITVAEDSLMDASASVLLASTAEDLDYKLGDNNTNILPNNNN
jgi:hypothetical protein